MTSSDGDRVRDASVGSGITRYWSPRDASVPLNEGYLADLDAFGMHSPALRTIDQLAELQSGCSRGPSAPIMRHLRRKNGLRRSVVIHVLAALVEQVNGRPEGWLGLPGARTPGGDSRGHPSGAVTT